jgi:hypothetical protein
MMLRTHPPRLASVAAVLSLGLACAAHAASPAEQRDYDVLINQSANTCMNYVGKTAAPAIRSLKIEIVRVLIDRHVLLCPDSTLPEGQDAIWYGNHRAMVWNPSASGAADKVRAVLDTMTRDDAFPSGIRVWNTKGDEVKNQTVPAFRVNCVSASARDCARR